MNKLFTSKTRRSWDKSHPLLVPMSQKEEVFWFNSHYQSMQDVELTLALSDIEDANARLLRFAPYFMKVFPETQQNKGIIESPLVTIKHLQQQLSLEVKGAHNTDEAQQGNLMLKCDSHLPISGSVKARGGIYEIIKHAETIAINAGVLTTADNYAIIDSASFKALFSQHSIVVGSTGNLGLSIGIMSAQLGFKVTVHMSSDARAWKKQLLSDKGVIVIEYEEDYSKAVEQGRLEALNTKNCHFVDDENSQDLFLGYAVAAVRLKQQLIDLQIPVNAEHPLFVYLPCGVGGAPGGIAFGLKQVFGDNVHCFFSEPTAAPCMLLGMYTQLQDNISVQEIGIDGVTCADGLAVGRPSAFVGRFMQNILSGIYTISDDELFRLLALMKDTQQLELEPSALAGVIGMQKLLSEGEKYIMEQNLQASMSKATHIAWATGGNMVPQIERDRYYQIGKALLAS
ncbi:MAG: D-serine dehydratase [Oceanospirillaceae bacterium]|jgi:D-serine dehydratase